MANQTLDQSLRFVQVQADAAYIDSRVYCAQVIQVDHADWFSNVLKKYQDMVEFRFGSIRFENGTKTSSVTGRSNPKPEVYALLTEAQCNAFLTFSRNTGKVASAKLDLIADFERAKQLLRSQLERQLAAVPTETISQLENALHSFPNTLDKLWKVSGIVNKSQVKNAIVRDFVEGRDYVYANGNLCVNDSTFHILAISFRSLKGADISQLPEIIHLKTREYFQYQQAKKMNRRIAQDCEWEQLLLF